MRLVLISEGFTGMERELERLKEGLDKKQLDAVDSLLEYLRNNAERLNYREPVGDYHERTESPLSVPSSTPTSGKPTGKSPTKLLHTH